MDRTVLKDIVQNYFEVSQKRGHWLTTAELKTGVPGFKQSYNQVRSRFGGLAELRDAAIRKNGVETVGLERTKYAQIDLVRKYYEESCKVGHWLTMRDLEAFPERLGLPYKDFYQIVGGLTRARRWAERMFADELGEMNPVHYSITDEDIVRTYFEASKARGCWLNVIQIRACSEVVSHQTIYKRFESIDALIEVAEQKYGRPFPGMTWDGRQNATDEEEATVREYYLASRAARHWLEFDKVPIDVCRSFGGIQRVKMHLVTTYGPLTGEMKSEKAPMKK